MAERRFLGIAVRLAVVVWLRIAALCVEAADMPVFPAPPRLATTVIELKKRKEGPDFAALRDRAVRDAEALLKDPVAIPDGWGNWVFYYACPDDGSTLKPSNIKEHQCPRCRKVYSDERTMQAYRTLMHDRANAAALQLGWAHAYTGEDRYAREVQRILLKYADDYAGYPQRRDRWGYNGLLARLGGRRYAQSLDEAVGIIALAKAYDLTRSSTIWDERQKKHVEEDFFRATASTLLWSNLDINNHQTWYNAGLMAISSVLGDEKLVNQVLTMRGGYRDQLRRSVGRDGLWYEGAMAYHSYALQAMIEIVDAGRRLGLPLHEEPRFRAMIEAPLAYAYPNGQFPAINDSDPGHINSFQTSFLWAWHAYSDPLFAHAYSGGNRGKLTSLLGAEAVPKPVIATRSQNLEDAGWAILRRGAGSNAVCVMLDHGPHGGSGHGHFDKLNIVLFAGPHQALWGGTWARDHRGAEMLRGDLEAAGIPYAVEGPDGPRFADFHSLRHSYLTHVGKTNDLRTTQELAGHSTPVLTARYTHRRQQDLAEAVRKLPSFLPTETVASSPQQVNGVPAPACTGLAQTPATSGHHGASRGTTSELSMTSQEKTKPLVSQGFNHQQASTGTCGHQRGRRDSNPQPRIDSPIISDSNPNSRKPVTTVDAAGCSAGCSDEQGEGGIPPRSYPGGDSGAGRHRCPAMNSQ